MYNTETQDARIETDKYSQFLQLCLIYKTVWFKINIESASHSCNG